MELKDLVGEHDFDAVDFYGHSLSNKLEPFVSHAQSMRFRLDGVIYIATEDIEDGYRIHMKNIFACENAKIKNTFKPVRVIANYKEKKGNGGDDDDCEILELIDKNTGLLLLEVGTDFSECYYPCFVSSFHAESMTA